MPSAMVLMEGLQTTKILNFFPYSDYWKVLEIYYMLLYVQAALPQGIVPFVFAREYNVNPGILSTGSVKLFSISLW